MGPDRKVVKVPDHFLRKGKIKNRAQLEKDLQAALSDVLEITKRIMSERRKQR